MTLASSIRRRSATARLGQAGHRGTGWRWPACALIDTASAKGGRDVKREEFVQSRPAGVPVMAVVSLSRQRVTLYDADGWIMRAPVSTGQTGYETPAGVYSILQRKVEHYSNLYDDAYMPFMQRITWSGIALHAGRPARLSRRRTAACACRRDFAERLFEVTRLGMRVIVMRDDIGPADISHPLCSSRLRARRGAAAAVARATVALIQTLRSAMRAPRRQRRRTPHRSRRRSEARRRRQEQGSSAPGQALRMAQAAQNSGPRSAVRADRTADRVGHRPAVRAAAEDAKAKAAGKPSSRRRLQFDSRAGRGPADAGCTGASTRGSPGRTSRPRPLPKRMPRKPSARWRRSPSSSAGKPSASTCGRRAAAVRERGRRLPIPTSPWAPTSSRRSPTRRRVGPALECRLPVRRRPAHARAHGQGASVSVGSETLETDISGGQVGARPHCHPRGSDRPHLGGRVPRVLADHFRRSAQPGNGSGDRIHRRHERRAAGRHQDPPPRSGSP